ncbi:unnamed protein product [Brassicogethes aeneus]|uniref:Methyltransferase type 11 domain-containing protein n=1 Tax=Brassicogethes aeneus TaxID=1431903 RepID=A0A9P0BEK9_BRAAE|nr:unnamed protein product [Brassicogethes aeneus]
MSSKEKTARSVALEQTYVHDVYEQLDAEGLHNEPWPKVEQFIDELEPGSIVCDIGCGNGKYLDINKSIFNIGAERSFKLSNIAREKQNEVIILDNLSLPFRDESLDAVISIAVIHHFASTERRVCALQELSRVLRIGGKLIISAWAMEQSHRKFETQDVLVPWHLPKQIKNPDFPISKDVFDYDVLSIYNGSYYNAKEESNTNFKSQKEINKKRNKFRKRKSLSTDSDSLTGSETCYSFIRRALQKLSGGRRLAMNRPWFLENWSNCTKTNNQKKYMDTDVCDCYDCIENIKDLPIELRRIDDFDVQLDIKFNSASTTTMSSFNDVSIRSKSVSNLRLSETECRSVSKQSSMDEDVKSTKSEDVSIASTNSLKKPKLVKQKKSICEDEMDELLDEPKDMTSSNNSPPEYKVLHEKYHQKQRKSVLKQRSLNEELMSTDRLKEKEQLKRNIQKQASLNEEYITQRHVFDSIKDSIFTSKGFHFIKMEFTNKIKNSTTNIEKVAGSSLKNGFVRIFQNWKNSDLISPTIPENESMDTFRKKLPYIEEKPNENTERRSSKEESSDSSKDSSLQSDTSVDSEDSFASVIYVPKSENMSPILSPGPISPRWKTTTAGSSLFSSLPNSPKIKQSSCPTSPKFKQLPLSLYPLTKQMSNPKPATDFHFCEKADNEFSYKDVAPSTKRQLNKTLAQKYSVQQIPKFRRTVNNTPSMANQAVETKSSTSNSNNTTTIEIPIITQTMCESPEPKETPPVDSRNERLKKIREILSKNPNFGSRTKDKSFPIVRRSSITNGKVEAVAKPLPKLLNLELFNPAVDDLDSDSSCISSPDSISDNFMAINCEKQSTIGLPDAVYGPVYPMKKTLLEAAADVANSLDQTVQKVIKYSPKAKRKVDTNEVMSILQRKYVDNEVLSESFAWPENWNEECHKHLTEFAEQISEKLLKQIDHYEEKNEACNESGYSDAYIARLSEELNDLTKISSEIQKQNEYLNKLSSKDKKLMQKKERQKKLLCDQCDKQQLGSTCKESSRLENCTCENRSQSDIKFKSLKNVSSDNTASTTPSTTSSSATLVKDLEMKLNGHDNISELSSCSSNINASDSNGFEEDPIPLNSNRGPRKSLTKNGGKTCENTNSGTKALSTSSTFNKSTDSSDSIESVISNKTGQGKESSEETKSQRSLDFSLTSNEGSTASLASNMEWKNIKTTTPGGGTTSDSKKPRLQNTKKSFNNSSMDELSEKLLAEHNNEKSSESLDSIQSEKNSGGEITFHRYYHVFREGELDNLIEKYVENLHIISSYYDHSSWCIIAEKVRVWTI